MPLSGLSPANVSCENYPPVWIRALPLAGLDLQKCVESSADHQMGLQLGNQGWHMGVKLGRLSSIGSALFLLTFQRFQIYHPNLTGLAQWHKYHVFQAAKCMSGALFRTNACYRYWSKNLDLEDGLGQAHLYLLD